MIFMASRLSIKTSTFKPYCQKENEEAKTTLEFQQNLIAGCREYLMVKLQVYELLVLVKSPSNINQRQTADW